MASWELAVTLAAGIALGLLAAPVCRRFAALGRRPRHLRSRGIRRRSSVRATDKPAFDNTLSNEDDEQHVAR